MSEDTPTREELARWELGRRIAAVETERAALTAEVIRLREALHYLWETHTDQELPFEQWADELVSPLSEGGDGEREVPVARKEVVDVNDD